MATSASIDVDATQRLRDILKLDRPRDPFVDDQKPSLKENLNGFPKIGQTEPENSGIVDDTLLDQRLQNAAMVSFLNKQVIFLSGDDSSTSIAVTGKDVEIVASNDSNICSKARGSNKVKIQPVAKYDWEQKYYYGSLIAVSKGYLAYATRGSNGSAMIRVLSVTTADRILLKGITGSVTDLAFAHLNSNQLACLDEAGNLFVWRFKMESGKIQDEIVVHIQRSDQTPLNTHRRIIWCPYIPEENEDMTPEDTSQAVALLHENMAEVWDLEIIQANHTSWPMDICDIKEGFIVVKGHTGRLSEGALSPDGTVLATASHDGFVKFWQIYNEGLDQPRCLHEWKPHSGRPVSCLLFCDNHKKQDPEVPFWRFLITGADQNRELKMWCTVSWTCLQTVSFSPDPFSSSVLPGLKVCLDLSAEFLILTDVQRKVLYVMELQQNQEDGRATFTSVSEFLLTHPVLSFGIQDVCHQINKLEVLPTEEENITSPDEALDSDGGDDATAVIIKLFCVHTKALQDVQIRFKPHHNMESLVLSVKGTEKDLVTEDELTELTPENRLVTQPLYASQSDVLRNAADFVLVSSDPKPKLMTPDAFMTPSVQSQQIVSSAASSIGSLTSVTALSNASTDTELSRLSEEIIHSPKLQLDSSIVLSNALHCGSFPASPQNSAALISGLSEKVIQKAIVQVSPSSMTLELQSLEQSLSPQTSPNRERSPDVISSASTVVSQDIPEIASEALQRGYTAPISLGRGPEDLTNNNHASSMSTAASALHLLSTRNCNLSEHGHRPLETGCSEVQGELTGADLALVMAERGIENKVDEMLSQPWPVAPDITRETKNTLNESDPDVEVTSVAMATEGFGGKRQSPRLHVKDWKTNISPICIPKSCMKSIKDNKHLTQTTTSPAQQMNFGQHEEVMALLYNQQRELSELRQNQQDLLQRLTDHLGATQSSIIQHMERVIDTQQAQEQRRLDCMLNDGQQRNGQLQEYLSQQLSQSLAGCLSNRLDKTIREEIKRTVPLCLSKTLEPMTGQLNSTIAAKFTSMDGTIKDSVVKIVKSKNITDAVGRAVADSLQTPIQTEYREAFQSVVLPAFEKGCQSMFQQINVSFQQGTQEYMQQFETHLKNRKIQEQDTCEPLITQLQQSVESLQTTADQMSSKLASSMRSEVQHQLHVAVGNMQDSILNHVQRIIKEEVNLAMKEQQAAVTSSIMHAMRSAAGTPIQSTHFDFHSQQTHILQLLQQGHLNQAFQQALTASDLHLILYVCETVDSQQVFGQHPCPLTQPVLLSLIQQLSFDLSTQTELKLNYLEEAVMHLDHSEPVTRDHMGSVMTQVRQKLFQFLQVEPHNALQKPARRLMIMLQGLITSNIS